MQNPYTFLETYCLRTPIFSLGFYETLLKDSKIGLDQLRDLWRDASIQEAIFLASSELHGQIESYVNTDVVDKDKLERLIQTFLKYMIRASTRCTPYGLFAGVSIGDFSKKSDIGLKLLPYNERVTNLDMNYMSSLLSHVVGIENIKDQLLFYPNTSLYTIANQFRYVEHKLEKDLNRSYSVEAIEVSKYLKIIIANAKGGKKLNELTSNLVNDEISLIEARAFVETLINHQILLSELELSTTGHDALYKVIATLEKIEGSEEINILLTTLKNAQTS